MNPSILYKWIKAKAIDVTNIEIKTFSFLFNFLYNPNLNIISSNIGAKIQAIINSAIISRIFTGTCISVAGVFKNITNCSNNILTINDRNKYLNNRVILIFLTFKCSFISILSFFL